jgi:hypothetical protein
MKFKVRFVSAVFNLSFWNSENNEETKLIPYFCPMQKNIETSQFEFVALMASLMSVVALAIDALLPALDIISDYWDYQSWITNY